jgi:hypothetical protein
MRLHAGRVLPTYVRLDRDRNREVKNTLAYYDSEFITTENNFIVQTATKNCVFHKKKVLLQNLLYYKLLNYNLDARLR